MRYRYAGLACLLAISVWANAGRMPNEISHLESVGKGYVKLYAMGEGTEGEYHIIHSYDVRRLVGHDTQKVCYLFYDSGAELLKLPVLHQACPAVLSELIKSGD